MRHVWRGWGKHFRRKTGLRQSQLILSLALASWSVPCSLGSLETVQSPLFHLVILETVAEEGFADNDEREVQKILRIRV